MMLTIAAGSAITEADVAYLAADRACLPSATACIQDSGTSRRVAIRHHA